MLATIRILAEMREGGFSYNSNADVFCWHLKCEDFQRMPFPNLEEKNTWNKDKDKEIVGSFYISEVSETFAV